LLALLQALQHQVKINIITTSITSIQLRVPDRPDTPVSGSKLPGLVWINLVHIHEEFPHRWNLMNS